MSLINRSLLRRRLREAMAGQSTQVSHKFLVNLIAACESESDALILLAAKHHRNEKRIGHIPKKPKRGDRRRKAPEQPVLL